MRIAICGKMCSGKSTLANYIKYTYSKYNFTIDSFAKKIYELAKELFNMKEKNRSLLISIGTKMREIDNNVWCNYIENKYKNEDYIIIDDLRFENEAKMLKKNNFFLIKLNISNELQEKRIKNLYKNYDDHLNKRNDESELNIDCIDEKYFDLVINVDKKDPVIFIQKYILNKNFTNLNR